MAVTATERIHTAAHQVSALLVDRVELRTDHVEARAVVRASSHHPNTDTLALLHLQRLRLVLGCVAVEHGQRGGACRDQLRRVLRQLVAVGGGLSGVVQVRLALDHHVLVIDRVKVRRVNDDRAVHALGHVQTQRGGTAVVQPDTGGLRLKTVDETLTGGDGLHRVIGGHHARVEVQRVAHRAVIDECNFKNVADLATQNRCHVLSVERPHVNGHAGRHLAVDFLNFQGDLADGLAVHPLGGVRCRDVRVAVLVAAAGRCGHVNPAVRNGHKGRRATRCSMVVAARRTVVVATLRHLVCGGAGRLHLEHHAQGAVTRHGAVAFLVGGNDAGINGFRFAGVDNAGGRAVVEGQVVGHALIVVGDFNDQAVTGGHLHLGGGETVVAGRLHLHGGGLTGRSHGTRRRNRRQVQRGRVHGEAQQERHSNRECRLEALLGVRDGCGGQRLLVEGGLLAAGARLEDCLAGAHRNLHAAHHERNERRQRQRAHNGDRHLNGLTHHGAGQHENNERQVHGGHATGSKTAELLIGGAHHRRAATHQLRQQVAHRTQQHLQQEAHHEDGGDGAYVQLRERGGCHHVGGGRHANNQPEEAHTDAHRRVLGRALGAQGTHHHPRDNEQSDQVDDQARGSERTHPEHGAGKGQHQAAAHQVQGAQAVSERLINHLRAQHGRPEGHQRTHHGNTDEAEHVHDLVRE